MMTQMFAGANAKLPNFVTMTCRFEAENRMENA